MSGVDLHIRFMHIRVTIMTGKKAVFRAKSQQVEWALCMMTTVLLVVAKLGFGQSCGEKFVKGAFDCYGGDRSSFIVVDVLFLLF